MPATVAFGLFQIGAPLWVVNAVAGVGIIGSITHIAGAIAISVGLQYLSGIFFGRQAQPKPSEQHGIIRQSAAPRTISVGRVKTSGLLCFAESEDGVYWRVIALDSCETDAIEEHWLDDRVVDLDENGDATSESGYYSDIPRVSIDARLGTDEQAHYDELATAFPSAWTEDHKGNGVTHALVKLVQPKQQDIAKMFPTGPYTNYRAVRRAAKVRTITEGEFDAAAWSENAAAILFYYLTHADGARLADSWVLNAATENEQAIADCADAIPLKAGGTEDRYRISGSWRFDERPADVISRFLAACDGMLMPTPERGLALKVGKWEAPTVTIDANAIVGISDFGRGRDALTTANTVRAQYVSRLHDYKETDADPWVDDDDVLARGEIAQSVELYAVPSHSQARRLMKVLANRLNPEWTGTLVTNLRALPALGHRFVNVEIEEYGIDQAFEILGVEFVIGEDGSTLTGLQFQIATLPESAYAWDAASEEGTAPEVPEDTGATNTIPAPANYSVTLDTRTISGVQVSVAVLDWDAPTNDSLVAEARGKKTADSSWTVLSVSPEESATESGPLEDGQEYEFEARFVSLTGRVSTWATDDPVTAGTPAPPIPTGFTATLDGADVDLAWTMPNSAMVVGARIWRAPSTTPFGSATDISGLLAGSALQAMTYTDVGPAADDYDYWVTAEGSNGALSPEAGPEPVTVP
jgi:hypothetical protein